MMWFKAVRPRGGLGAIASIENKRSVALNGYAQAGLSRGGRLAKGGKAWSLELAWTTPRPHADFAVVLVPERRGGGGLPWG